MIRPHISCFFILIFFTGLCAFAQTDSAAYYREQARKRAQRGNEKKEKFKDKLYFGGNVGLAFSNTSGYFDISPNAGYKITPMLSGGIQLIYTQANYKYPGASKSIVYNYYGSGLFARIKPLDFLFLHAEYDIMSVPKRYLGYQISERTIIDEKMAGIGLNNYYGEKFSYYVMFLYVFDPQKYSPYADYPIPIIGRAGFVYNF